jgi:hypothetical protein
VSRFLEETKSNDCMDSHMRKSDAEFRNDAIMEIKSTSARPDLTGMSKQDSIYFVLQSQLSSSRNRKTCVGSGSVEVVYQRRLALVEYKG